MKAFIYVRHSETESQTKIHLNEIARSADEFKHTMDSQLEHQSREQQKLMDYTKYTCYTIIIFTNKKCMKMIMVMMYQYNSRQ